MKVSVTTQPQAIYPDGLQDDMVVSNVGPGTVWLGSDTSTSIGQSMPLAPLSSVHWNKGLALWAVTDTLSDLRIERAIEAPASDGTRRVDSIKPLSSTASTDGYTTPAIAMFEVGAYESIIVPFPLLSNGPGSVNIDVDLIVVTVSWYASVGGILVDEYTIEWAALSPGEVSSFVRNVKAQFCQIRFDNAQGGALMPTSPPTLFASTIPIAERVGTNSTGFRAASPTFWTVGTDESGERFASMLLSTTGYAGRFIHLPYLGQRLSVSLHMVNAGATSASALVVRTRNGVAGTTSHSYAFMPIPVGTTNSTVLNDVVQPPGKMSYLMFETSVGAGVQMSLTARWRD